MIEARDARTVVRLKRYGGDNAPLDNTLAETEIIVRFPSQDRIRVTTQRTVSLFSLGVFGGQPGDQRDGGCRRGRGRYRRSVPETCGGILSHGPMKSDGRYRIWGMAGTRHMDLVPLGT